MYVGFNVYINWGYLYETLKVKNTTNILTTHKNECQVYRFIFKKPTYKSV